MTIDENGIKKQWEDGTKEWRLNRKLHRVDGPAYTEDNGREEWWIHGLLHREDGPAVTWEDVTKEWWVSNQRHRMDGPAIIRANGTKEWWVNDIRCYDVHAYQTVTNRTDQEMNVLVLTYGDIG